MRRLILAAFSSAALILGLAPAASAHTGAKLSSPSGVPMPGAIAGWTQTFADDFTGSAVNTDAWQEYWGQPGGDPGGWWDPSHDTVSGGLLHLTGSRDAANCPVKEGCTASENYVTGGLATYQSQTYGMFRVRFRMAQATGVALVALLWPADNSWPPEIDFAEDNGADRQTNYATEHYGPYPADHQIEDQVAVDMTGWHTLGVKWLAGKIVYTLDGATWATETNSHVPSIPMTLCLQTQAWGSGDNWETALTPSTPNSDMQVDWVVGYSQN